VNPYSLWRLYSRPVMLKGDARDAHLFQTYARMRLTVRGRHAILSGLAGFQREVTV
jgi:hypothetical protein